VDITTLAMNVAALAARGSITALVEITPQCIAVVSDARFVMADVATKAVVAIPGKCGCSADSDQQTKFERSGVS
jgi:hypothetical protein